MQPLIVELTGVARKQLRLCTLAKRSLVTAALLTLFACNRYPEISIFPPHFETRYPAGVPVILLAEALEDCRAIAPYQWSRWDHRPLQLYRVRIKVEQVLQGKVDEPEVDIYYYVDQGNGSGTRSRLSNIRSGSSEVFFLQRENNNLRTICDGWRNCVIWVRTGSHFNDTGDRGDSIEAKITRILLGRGDHTTDQELIDAMNHPTTDWGLGVVVHQLQELEKTEQSPEVLARIATLISVYTKSVQPWEKPLLGNAKPQ